MPSQTATMLSISLVPMIASTSGKSFVMSPAIAFHQAAGDNQPFGLADALILRHFENRVDRFLLRGVDETARVYDENVRLVGMRGELMPAGSELAHHHFTIDEVFRAAEADKTDFQGRYYKNNR